MNKKRFLPVVFLFLSFSIFAQEEEAEQKINVNDFEYNQVEGLENWTYDYDISGLKDGKYNLIIRSRDKAGNFSRDESINIYIDSESDIPTVSISSPSQNMRIGGNFNIVGTAGDDDGVDFIEIKLDDNPYKRAQGGDFWSSFLDISSVPDGKHTITVRVTDINGIMSSEKSVQINVDKLQPVISINSHDNGEILSGRINIEGTVFDSNGVEYLEYSRDGETYEELKLSGREEQIERNFSIKIDTRKNEGGTDNIFFRTVDGTGSDNSSVFVYYSDNQKPEILINSPIEGDIVNGLVTVSGTVTDEVGIAGLFYRVDNGDEIEIPVITGNPYWSQTVDPGVKKVSTVTFRAIDLSGNIGEHKLRLKLNPETDLPEIILLNFQENMSIGNDLIKGIASDDDGVLAVEYAFDKDEYSQISSEGPFVISIAGLEPGKHTLRLQAVDMSGLKSAEFKNSFNITADAPIIKVDQYTSNKTIGPFVDGAVFQQGKTAKINGNVSGGEGVVSIIYTVGTEEEKTVRSSKGLFSITLPNKLVPGGYDLKLTAVDGIGRESKFSSRIYFAPAPGKDAIYEPVQLDSEQLYIIDSRLDNNDVINISGDFPLTGFISGDSIQTVKFDPAVSSFTVNTEGNNFSIIPVSETKAVTFNLVVTTSSGKEYVSEKITVGSDFNPPLLILDKIKVPVEVESVTTSSRVEKSENDEEITKIDSVVSITNEIVESNLVNDTLYLSGSFSDVSEIRRAEVFFSGSAESYGDSRTLVIEDTEGQYVFDQEIDLAFIPEGEHFLTVEVEDVSGNIQSETIPFIIDRTAPEIVILSPGEDVSVEGVVTVCGRIDNFTGGGELFFSSNGIEYSPVEIKSYNSFSHDIDLSATGVNPDDFIFRVVDRSRNKLDFKPYFTLDVESDRPVVSIEIPAMDSTVRGDFTLTGLVFDDDAVGKIYYSFDDGDFIEIEGNNYYNIPINLQDFTDGIHTITVKAEDSGGFMSEDTISSFLISKAEPVSTLLSPAIEDFTKRTIQLSGETYDENGVESIYISYDNGITFNKAILGEVESETMVKTVNWTYSLDTRLPGDGIHSILMKAVDGGGIIGFNSTIINVDNANPEIKLDSPFENGIATGKLIIDGKVFDRTSVKSVVAELKALEGDNFELTRDIMTDGVFKEIIDVSAYTPGLYNLNIVVTDHADNSTSETRNFYIAPPERGESVDLYFPEEGKDITGPFFVGGRLYSQKGVRTAVLMIDGSKVETTEVDSTGLFSFSLDGETLADGGHVISVESGSSPEGISSGIRNIVYKGEGPWVKVESMRNGQFVSGRPMITGIAGYTGSDEDRTKKVDKVEVSLDNGKTFSRGIGREKWEFRLETYDLPEGENQLIIRVLFRDGQYATTKLLVNVDETLPEVDLITPEENRKVNDNVALIGTAGDENGLESVEVLIRKGSKEMYSVPSFIQGLYLDFHGLGTTYGEIGIGLSFFDDVVKLQAQIGLAPPGRFTGIVVGAKLLATIIDIPFSFFFGYDWEVFSMSISVGANFNYFSMSEGSYSFIPATGRTGVILGAVVGQFEFAKFDFKKLKAFSSYSLYVEGSLWFISSDVQPEISPTISFGLRVGIL